MPLLPKRETDTCRCQEGDPVPSCVYHGRGSYLIFRRNMGPHPRDHVVVTVKHHVDGRLGRIFRVQSLCTLGAVTLPWEGMEELHREALETELREGDGRTTVNSNQLGTGAPTCPECISRVGPGWSPPEILTLQEGLTCHLRRYAGEGPPRCGWTGKNPGLCLECLRPGTWVEWVPPVLTEREHRRRRGLDRMLASAIGSYLEGFGWVRDARPGFWSHEAVGGRRRTGYIEEKALKTQRHFEFLRRIDLDLANLEEPEDNPDPVSRFERDLGDA